MNQNRTHPTAQPPAPNPQSPVPQSPAPKEAWSEPDLRVTPIAETASSKGGLGGDGTNAFSS